MNDPRITAYAVGELDPAEREAFERELATSTELQRELAETVALSEALSRSLADPSATLDDDARRKLVETFANREALRTRKPLLQRAWIPALAAGIVAVLTLVTLQTGREHSPALLAQAPMPQEMAPSPTTRKSSASQVTTEDSTPDVGSGVGLAMGANTRRSEPALVESAAEPALAHAQLEAASPMEGGDAAFGFGSAEVAKAIPATAPEPRQTVAMNETRARMLPVDSPVGGMRAALDGIEVLRRQPLDGFHTEAYDSVAGNTFLDVEGNPLSTFSIDVDTASYANVRRFLNEGRRPPAGAVRIEELINYFPYSLPQPEGDAPFSITTDASRAPWNPGRLLARIALKGRDLDKENLPPSNLVFLVDVSGSMQPANKLPLLKRALRGLVDQLTPRDTVSIVTYAGSSGLVLSPTDGNDKAAILAALDRLESGGSTNGAGGIQLAYETARKHFLKEGNNRVILCTDGDFNVGVTSQSELVDLIERERKSGVFLSVLGFGTGNVKDSTMEKLADKGNGNYAYIDSPSEARKVLVEQMGGTLFTIAKDVKIQVEFNPATVAGYRLIGYENRLLAKEDFNDDTKDAGEIGAGHTVTALYEIIPAGQKLPTNRSVDPLKYQAPAPDPVSSRHPASNDLFTVKLRYKAPDGDTSKLLERVVGNEVTDFEQASADLRFAAAVAAYGMNLRGDENDSKMDWAEIQRIARGSLGDDPGSYRAEFLTLVEKAKAIANER
jgi:Uncharacterized protein containing a von Willebrand factor type A (vWA) domain